MKNRFLLVLVFLFSLPFAQAITSSKATFEALENRISHAVVSRDVAEMNTLFAADYMSVGVTGKVRSRAEIVEAYSKGTLKLSESHPEVASVREYGDMAIVVGYVTVIGKDGEIDISGRYAFTRVYRREASQWKAVSFQATPVK